MACERGDILQLTARMRVAGTDVQQNVWHFYVDQEGGVSDADAVANMEEWLGGVQSQLDDLQGTALSYEVNMLYNLTQDRPLGAVASTEDTGKKEGDPLPHGVAALISMYTSVKRTIGKKYIGFLTESALDAGLWNAETLSTLDDIAEYFFKRFAVGGNWYIPVVYNRKLKTWASIVLYVIRNIPSYQRRRKPGVGA